MTDDGSKRRASEKRQREAQILVRLTAEELAQADALADRAGLTRAAFARAAIIGSTGPRAQKRTPADKATLLRILGELGRVGNNVNQLARAANAGLDIDQPALKQAITDIADMRETVRTALNRRPETPAPSPNTQTRFLASPEPETRPRKGKTGDGR
jgi:Bacterial mobilisation protein (MobC)